MHCEIYGSLGDKVLEFGPEPYAEACKNLGLSAVADSIIDEEKIQAVRLLYPLISPLDLKVWQYYYTHYVSQRANFIGTPPPEIVLDELKSADKSQLFSYCSFMSDSKKQNHMLVGFINGTAFMIARWGISPLVPFSYIEALIAKELEEKKDIKAKLYKLDNLSGWSTAYGVVLTLCLIIGFVLCVCRDGNVLVGRWVLGGCVPAALALAHSTYKYVKLDREISSRTTKPRYEDISWVDDV